ncbi:MAG: hypothetical protein ACK4UL_10880 [Novosphingobium meiothermophilum]|uniref:hypothetical protein n=1 Tax=Novosphingobium TaxID=165696 RepID=UPI000D6DE29F|nr:MULTISPECIES: hypothetical protein [Novosphingobium]
MSDPAAGRFMALQILRLCGAVLVLLGVMIGTGRGPAILAAIPDVAGYLLCVIGMIAFFWVPRLLARKWRTPD